MRARERREPTILFVAVPSPLGGSNRSLATLMTALEGSARRVLAAPADGAFSTFAEERGFAEEYVPLPSGSRWQRIKASLVLARLTWARRTEIVSIHAQALTGLNLVVPAAAITRIPVLVRVSDPEGSKWGRLLGPMIRVIVRDLRVVAVSDTARDVAVTNGLCKSNEAIVIPNPVDPNEVRAIETIGSPPPLRVGFLGGATRRKGWDILLDVIGSTMDLDLEWKLFISRPSTEKASTLGSFPAGRVDVVGRVVDVREAYAVCDIIFVPSRAESFCRVVAEAMANGIAVVATDLAPIRSLLGESEAGLLFASGDREGADRALRQVAEQSGLRDEFGRAGVRRVRSYEPATIAHRFIPLYGLDHRD